MEAHNHIGVRDLRAELATYLKRAEAGDRLIVTVDGRTHSPNRPAGTIWRTDPRGSYSARSGQKTKNETKPPMVQPAQTPIDISIDRIIKELRGP